MRIIFIFNLAEMQIMIYELAELLRQDGFNTYIYDFTSCKKYDPVTKKITSMDSFWWAPFILKFKYVRGLFKPIINRRTIRKEFTPGDIIHIQYIHPSYLKYIDDIKKAGSKLIATFWGSDYLKANDQLKSSYQNLLESSTYLACSNVVCDQVGRDFPTLTPKLRRVFFGCEILKVINAVSIAQKDQFKNKYAIPAGKTIITLGYNAGNAQRHDEMIDMVNKLDDRLKETIHILLPVTYGGNAAYKEQLRQLLNKTGLTFTMFETMLSTEDVAILRCVSDVVVNIQRTDAFAGAISESIEGGNVLIVGDWLPYATYEEWGLFLLRVKKEEVFAKMNEVLNNLEYWKDKAAPNKGKLDEKLSWSGTFPAWKNLYTSLQQQQ